MSLVKRTSPSESHRAWPAGSSLAVGRSPELEPPIKSKVASRGTWRARSLKKTAAPLRTPTKIIDWPRKSRAISAPISATRLAMVSRDSNTLRSGIGDHFTQERSHGRQEGRGSGLRRGVTSGDPGDAADAVQSRYEDGRVNQAAMNP